jgi:plastocyanin
MKKIAILFSALVVGVIMLISNTVHATKWVVNVQNFTFSPSNLPNVIVGDTIRWVWISGTHTTTSTTIPAGAASWDHPITSSNTFYEYPVTIAGTYNYKCTPHEGMGMVGSFTATVLTPLLVSISPNQAVQGASFMATITGSNTNFNGSPAVSLTYSNNPGEIINATSVIVISPTVLHANFTIPGSASPGLWDVHVNSLVLDNGFTVIEAVPAILLISPNSASQGDSFTGNITGQYTSWSGTPSVYLSFSGNPSEIITGTNVVVVNSTHLHADFAVPSDASPGLWAIHVDALQLVGAFTVIEVVPAITFMEPNIAHQGDSFNGTILGQNTSWTGTPTVYLSYSNNPSEIINGTNVVVVSNTELTADFTIPADASTGNYTVHVDALDQANAFTVLVALTPALAGISPDNGKQGLLVPTTITAENTSFVGVNHSVYLSFHADPLEIIQGAGVVVVDNTTLTADFDIPYEATPGLWDLHVDALTLQNAFTVIDVIPSLVSIVPDSANQGEQVSSLITALDSRFLLSTPAVSLSFSSNPSEVIDASSVNVLNDTQLEAVFDIPTTALVGGWDLHVDDMVIIEGFTVNLLAGLNDLTETLVRIYPNPASQVLYVENAAGADVAVFNTAGENVEAQRITSDKQVFDISRLYPGIYVVRIRMNGNDRVEKLLVN